MVNYNNSHIYKLCCKDTDIKEIYIGSTINFRNRKCAHKTNCNNINNKKHNYKVYQFIREHGGFENWEMILIENVNCNTKLELHKIERKYIEELQPSLNKHLPLRNKKEYYNDNKEKITEHKKEYRIKNKDKINESQKEKFTCECGGKFTKCHKSRHFKSKKHIKFLQTFQD